MQYNPQTVLDFWFAKDNKAFWFVKDFQFDRQIRIRFLSLWHAAAGELFAWRETPAGRLAEIIVLDRFFRNLFRNSATAFAQDAVALVPAQEAINQPETAKLPGEQRQFILMPFMHSESAFIHAYAIPLFAALNMAEMTAFAGRHQMIIERFGRYPHRNAILNRESSAEEIAFLQQPGSVF